MDYTGVHTINVHVFPSKSDHDLTGGLCGTLNGNENDDFMDRDGNELSGTKEFIKYWRYVFLNINFFKVKNQHDPIIIINRTHSRIHVQ